MGNSDSKQQKNAQGSSLLSQERRARRDIRLEWADGIDELAQYHPLSPEMIATYKIPENLVVVYRGGAYNCTPWLNIHPGGSMIFFKHAGRDVTHQFDHTHSKKAKAHLAKLRIGPVYLHDFLTENQMLNYMGQRQLKHIGTPLAGPIWNGHSYFDDPEASAATADALRDAVRGIVTASPILPKHDDNEYRVLHRSQLTRDVYQIDLACPDRYPAEVGAHVRVHHNSMSRPYNPCFIDDSSFSLIVKRYENGPMSNYLTTRSEGDVLTIEGPLTPAYDIVEHKYDTLLLIGQGVGVVPLLGIAKSIPATTIFILSCFRRPDDVILAREMAMLPDEKVRLVYFFSGANRPLRDEVVPGPAFHRRLNSADVDRLNIGHADCSIICGSNEFIASAKDVICNTPSLSINPENIKTL